MFAPYKRGAESDAREYLPVTAAEAVAVSKDVIYQTELTAAYAGIAAGAKVTISSNGLGITATTTSGVAEIVDWDGTAVGSPVRVRF